MPCSQTRFRHNCTVGRLTPSCSAMDTLSWPARAPKIIRQRSATCCGVPYDDSHFSSCVRSAGSNWIAMLVFGMSEIIATTGNAVKLFKGHYTRTVAVTFSYHFLGCRYGLANRGTQAREYAPHVLGFRGDILVHGLEVCLGHRI